MAAEATASRGPSQLGKTGRWARGRPAYAGIDGSDSAAGPGR